MAWSFLPVTSRDGLAKGENDVGFGHPRRWSRVIHFVCNLNTIYN